MGYGSSASLEDVKTKIKQQTDRHLARQLSESAAMVTVTDWFIYLCVVLAWRISKTLGIENNFVSLPSCPCFAFVIISSITSICMRQNCQSASRSRIVCKWHSTEAAPWTISLGWIVTVVMRAIGWAYRYKNKLLRREIFSVRRYPHTLALFCSRDLTATSRVWGRTEFSN